MKQEELNVCLKKLSKPLRGSSGSVSESPTLRANISFVGRAGIMSAPETCLLVSHIGV